MLKRKIIKNLVEWKENHQNNCLLLIGARQVGQTYILKTFANQYYEKVIYINFIENASYIDIFNGNLDTETIIKKMSLVVPNSLIIPGKTIIILDEIQLVKDFEYVLNSYLYENNMDVYVTGSNSKFLSSDIITEFRGRGDEIRVFPLSFKEFMEVYPKNKYDGWSEYILYGGMPLIISKKSDEEKSKYLKDLFTQTYIKDICNNIFVYSPFINTKITINYLQISPIIKH